MFEELQPFVDIKYNFYCNFHIQQRERKTSPDKRNDKSSLSRIILIFAEQNTEIDVGVRDYIELCWPLIKGLLSKGGSSCYPVYRSHHYHQNFIVYEHCSNEQLSNWIPICITSECHKPLLTGKHFQPKGINLLYVGNKI